MNQEKVTNVNEEVMSEDKAVVDWGFDEEKVQEVVNEINREIQDAECKRGEVLKRTFGINEKIYEICKGFDDLFTDTMELIERGNEQQRNEGLHIMETFERLNIVRMGTTLGLKDVLVTFNGKKFEKPERPKKKLEKKKAFAVGLPEAGLTKEEFDKNIEQQILSQYEDAPKEVIEATIESSWKVYETVSAEEKSE